MAQLRVVNGVVERDDVYYFQVRSRSRYIAGRGGGRKHPGST